MVGFLIFYGICMIIESRIDCRCFFLFLKEGNDEDDEILCIFVFVLSRLA